jgi:hypothetical protein
MVGLLTDPRDEFVLKLTTQEAVAVERCLRSERALQCGTLEKLRCIYFGRAAPRSVGDTGSNEHELTIRVWERSSEPDEVVLEVRELRHVRLALPRKALRAAMRPNVLQEISPGLPHDLVPMLGVELSRRTWRHESGWWVALDREIAYHRLHPRALERTGNLVLGIPDKCLDDCAALTVGRTEAMMPDWLEQLVSASGPWDLFREGLMVTAPRPTGATVAPGLRLILQ